jgi:DNA-binding SARP family transcriptional activator
LYLQTSQPVEALVFANKYLQFDAVNEEVHQMIMRCYASMGNVRMVVKQYQKLSSLLEKELGSQPSPQTVSLYDLLTRNRRKTEADI